MALTKDQVEQRLDAFFEAVRSNVNTEVADKALPLLGKLADVAGIQVSDPFQQLKQDILQAVDSASDADVANSIAGAINGLGLSGVSATATPGGGLDISFDQTANVATDPFDLSTGDALGSLFTLEAEGSAQFEAAIHAQVQFGSDGTFTLVDTGAPEVTVAVDAAFSLQNLSANLGIAELVVSDSDPDAPEFSVDFGIDLSLNGGVFEAETELSGSAALDLTFETSFLADLLPKIRGDLSVGFAIDGDIFAAPEIVLGDVTLNLKEYLGIVGDALGDIARIFNHGALGTIVDIATEPVPALDGLAQGLPYLYGIFDKVGSITGGGDGVITIGDLAAYTNPALAPQIEKFYQAVAIIAELRQFGATNDAGEINIGGGSLLGGLGGTRTDALDPQAILDQLGAEIDGLSELSDIAKDFLKEIDGALPPGAQSTGFTLSLLENPETILDIFFQKDTPVDILKYDLPGLGFDVAAGGFFPVLGPLGFVLEGALRAGIDVDIGYDTQSLIDGNFFSGFYFSTKTDDPDVNGVSRVNPITGLPFDWEPVGWLDTTITGGAGINFVAGEAGVAASFGFNVDAYFKDEKFRPATADFGCAFDIAGRAVVDVHLYIEVGFGPFSVEKNISLASATLADFRTFTCPPATVVATPLEPGLATASGVDLLLNVGDRAAFRIIKDNTGPSVAVANEDDPATPQDESQVEAYVVSLARDPGGDDVNPLSNPPPVVVPGALDVSAFGFTQRVGIPAVIRADFKAGNDLVVIQKDVLVDSVISGGDGNDTMVGGGGRDVLNGDAGGDSLVGGDGDDELHGGADDDTLEGGKGADLLDGGGGIDTVDYSRANRDVGVGIYVTLSDVAYFGSGGEAEGDRFISVENVVGTDYADYIRATHATFSVYLEGGRGSDVLIGGNANDLLIGGEGADTLTGQGGEDGTSYIMSWGWVDVDLQRSIQYGGDAQGDRLYFIEDVQGSINDDTLRGDGVGNLLDGSNGNDVLEGRGGVDRIFGGFGNDVVLGGADGDTLDGGPGWNTLTYRHLAGPVVVDLGIGDGAGADVIAMLVPAPPAGRGVSTFSHLIGTDSAAGDTLVGDLGDNRIEGWAGNDLIVGDGGWDTIVGGLGADIIIGGEGRDWTLYDDSSAGVTVDLQGTGIGGTAQGDTYFTTLIGDSVENVLGSRFADTLRGNSLDNILDPNISGAQVVETVDGRDGTGDTLRVNYSSWAADRGEGVVGGFAAGSASAGTLVRQTAGGGSQLDRVDFTAIERLDLTGTSKADTVFGGQSADRIVTNGGDDVVVAGRGADIVQTGTGNDVVAWGTTLARTLDFGGAPAPAPASFRLDGGRGLDTLSIDLSFANQGLVLEGRSTATEFFGTNFALTNAAAAENFEYLGDVRTGAGHDLIVQLGEHDNRFETGLGEDLIVSGLGFDTVDGGLDLVGAESGYGIGDDFAEAAGDRLELNYASLGGSQAIRSSTVLIDANIFVGGNMLRTNSGSYYAIDPTQGNATTTRVDFTGIEGLSVVGTGNGDVLVGTNTVYLDLNASRGLAENRGGDDVLRGGGGDDELYGQTGDDDLDGGDGADRLQGAAFNQVGEVSANFSDRTEIDTLTGGAGGDRFVLGDSRGSFYDDGGNEYSTGWRNYAVITDFDADEGDTIVLFDGADYRVEFVGDDAWLYLDDGFVGGAGYGEDDLDELIAKIEGVGGDFDLDAGYVERIGTATVAGALAKPAAVGAASAAQGTQAGPGAPAATASLLAAGWIGQATSLAELEARFEGASGVDGTLSVEGSAEAIGTFDGDPFGLGAGVILSTGRVEDLAGENTSNGPSSFGGSIALSFERIGTTTGTTIYRADLGGLGIDIRSLQIEDGGSLVGGSGGRFSGFDLDAIVLSNTRIDTVPSADALNDPTYLPQLNVFDFSNAGVELRPGSQRAGGEQATDLNGQVNGLLDGLASLGVFDATGSTSTVGRRVTLGDNGAIAFDLTRPVSTSSGPLYLYLSESGISTEETVRGFVSASVDTIEPTGDLSTDLGAAGLEGDTTRLTYTFTPGAGDTAFSFDAVLFSEELPEFDGTDLTDVFSIKLNGIDIGSLSNGAALTIKNLVYGGSGDLVSNAPGTGPLADQIRADAFTQILTISGAIVPGALNTLTIEVRDDRDAFLDSGILIKEGSFRTFVAPPIPTGNTPPQIDAPAGEVLVPENTTAVTTVDADDPDSGQTLTYEIVGGADADAFAIDPDTGVLRFKDAPDYENPTDADGDNRYDVLVKVTDDGNPSDFALQDYLVRVQDIVNENSAPDIAAPAGEILVAENTKAVVTVVAVDPNAGQHLTYSIVGGADRSLFAIDAATGKLSFKAAPDFEAPADADGDNVYDVVVGVSDDGVPMLGDSQAYKVRVTDAAERSTLQVTFVSERAGYVNSFGWYDKTTLEGGILFDRIEAEGRHPTVKPGVTTKSFSVDTRNLGNIGYFLIPNGGAFCGDVGGAAVRVIKQMSGAWAVALLAADGSIAQVLEGSGAKALFTETSRNAGGVDYASSKAGTQQTPATLAGDTADGPTGLIAWEDLAAVKGKNGAYGKPGDADYDDTVLRVTEIRGKTIYGTDAANTLYGTIADDVIYGAGGNDTADGGAGDDRIEGGPGNDVLRGGEGNDTFIARPGDGSDKIYGDGGSDTLDLSATAANATVTDTRATSTEIGNDDLWSIENVIGGKGNDVITLGSANNLVRGGAGADRIAGGRGDDVLEGGPGNDRFDYTIGDGRDRIDGGADQDTLSILGTAGRDLLEVTLAAGKVTGFAGGTVTGVETVRIDLLGNTDTLVFKGSGGVTVDLQAGTATGIASLAGVENVTTGSGNDTLKGGVGANVMTGGAGNDQYWLGAGDTAVEESNGGIDTIVTAASSHTLGSHFENLTFVGTGAFTGKGNAAANVIAGGAANDSLYGYDGNDRLAGGGGNDQLWGGRDNDVFVFGPGFGRDTVGDFDANPSGGQDKLDIVLLGISALTFASRVSIIDIGAHTEVHIDAGVIHLAGVNGVGSNMITQQDFILA